MTTSPPVSETTDLADLPGWGPPPGARLADPLPEGATVTEPPSTSSSPAGPGSPLTDGGDGGDELDEPVGPSSKISDGGRSPGSSAEAAAFYAQALAVPLSVAGYGLNRYLAPDTPAWIMDDQDLEGISQPLGRIIARRVPLGAGHATDLSDGIEAAVAASSYLLKSVAIARSAPERPPGDASTDG